MARRRFKTDAERKAAFRYMNLRLLNSGQINKIARVPSKGIVNADPYSREETTKETQNPLRTQTEYGISGGINTGLFKIGGGYKKTITEEENKKPKFTNIRRLLKD